MAIVFCVAFVAEWIKFKACSVDSCDVLRGELGWHFQYDFLQQLRKGDQNEDQYHVSSDAMVYFMFSYVFGLVCMNMSKFNMSCGQVYCCVISDGEPSRHSEKRSVSVAHQDTVMYFFVFAL